MKHDTRGQAFTLEGIAAAVLLLASLVFALQVAAVTPNSGSTANPNVGTQQAWVASDLLAEAAASDSLRASLLHWDDDAETFHGASSYGYYIERLPTTFGADLETHLYDRGFTYNVDVAYATQSGGLDRLELVNRGTPSDDAVRVVQYVTLYDDDELRNSDGSLSGTTLSDASFYATDVDPTSPVFNVVRVEVTVWRV